MKIRNKIVTVRQQSIGPMIGFIINKRVLFASNEIVCKPASDVNELKSLRRGSQVAAFMPVFTVLSLLMRAHKTEHIINNIIMRIILTLLLSSMALCIDYYHQVVHTTDPMAKCLDGTPPILYYHEGGDTKNFLVYFMEGKICEGNSLESTLQDCYQKSNTYGGSSAIGWPGVMEGHGILSPNSSLNEFANYTKIMIGSCDAAMHQGYRNNSISYKGKALYFRGSANTRSHFQWIMEKYPSFRNAEKVIITGGSEGGIAAFMWSNYVRGLINNPENVQTIVDSGVFLSYKTFNGKKYYFDDALHNVFTMANLDEKPPLKECNQKYVGEQYKCFSIYYAYTSFMSRTLVINSEYDSFVIMTILNISCLRRGETEYSLSDCTEEQVNYIEGYRQKFVEFMGLYIKVSKNSAWTIGCSEHYYSPTRNYFNSNTERVPANTGLNIKEAVHAFSIDGSKVVAMESKPWPSNTGCAL